MEIASIQNTLEQINYKNKDGTVLTVQNNIKNIIIMYLEYQ